MLNRKDKLPGNQFFEILVYRSVFTILIEEWVLAVEGHLVKHDTQRKYIHFGAAFLLYVNFRRHIQRCAFRGHVPNDLHVFNLFRQSKISNLEIAIVNEDVFGLDVSMNDPVVIENLIPFAELFQEEPDFLLWDVELFSDQVLVEVAFIAVLHDQVEVVFRGDLELHAVDEVGVVRQFLEDLKLSLDRYARFGVFN